MPRPAKRKISRLRRVFRWCRILILLAILAAVIAGLYLNMVGLPDFLKRPLVAKLREQGVQVDFNRMRLRWYQGIVVDQATFTFLKQPLHPQFTSAETELNFNFHSLLDSKLKLNSLTVERGNFVWPLAETNEPALTLSNINTRVRFHSDEEIELESLQADFSGAFVKVSGVLTNVSAVRNWKTFQPKEPGEKAGLEKFASVLRKIDLTGNPQLTLNFSGDAADTNSFRGTLDFASPSARTPWGDAKNVHLFAQFRDLLNPGENNFARLKMDAAETPWGSGSNLNFLVSLSSLSTNDGSFQTELKLSGKQIHSEFVRATSARLNGRSTQFLTNLIPTKIDGTAYLTDAKTKWGSTHSAEIAFTAATNSAPKISDESWSAWEKAEQFLLDWNAEFANVKTPKLIAEKISLVGSWSAPTLHLTNLDAQLYEGGIQLTGVLNVATREAIAQSASDFDVQKIKPFLTPYGQRWISRYAWEKPPKVKGDLRVVLPSWTNNSPNWREEVLPTLQLSGNVVVGRGSYEDVTATSANTSFTYSNMVWDLPHIRVNRPEGGADLNLVADDRAHSFHWRIHSQIDPKALRHLLEEKEQLVFDDFQFTTPPTIRAELRGRWNEMEKTTGTGSLMAENFSFKSNMIEKVNCLLLFTNETLHVSEGRLEHDGNFITAQKVQWHFPTQRLLFSNVYSTVDPYLATRLIGREAAEAIEPYQFTEPPAVRLNGGLTIGEIDDADLHFEVEGTEFKWANFDADRVSGTVDWTGQTLVITNIMARAYGGGRVSGWADFNFAVPGGGADYRFDIAAGDIDFQKLVRGLSGKTNHLEGMLHGQMTLRAGNTTDLKTLRGDGRVNLRDGLVWDVPIFGIFSPILNAIIPGAGNSRAREASADFMVANGLIHSENLEIRSATMRLQYRGVVDFQQRVDARVEAEPLRDAWIVGPLINFALTPLSKIFEYRVTGTLSEPESEPVYIPNFLMMTLRPFHSIKKALELGTDAPPTNAPPHEEKKSVK